MSDFDPKKILTAYNEVCEKYDAYTVYTESASDRKQPYNIGLAYDIYRCLPVTDASRIFMHNQWGFSLDQAKGLLEEIEVLLEAQSGKDI